MIDLDFMPDIWDLLHKQKVILQTPHSARNFGRATKKVSRYLLERSMIVFEDRRIQLCRLSEGFFSSARWWLN